MQHIIQFVRILIGIAPETRGAVKEAVIAWSRTNHIDASPVLRIIEIEEDNEKASSDSITND